MINDKVHSNFFSELDILEQFVLLKSFSEEPNYKLKLMSEYFGVSDKFLIELQNKTKTYLKNLEDLWNNPDILV